MIRDRARWSRASTIEDLYGVDPTGTVDCTTAMRAAAQSGAALLMRTGAIYRLSDDLPMASGTRFLGDGTQIFRQYTTNRGCFLVEGDDCEISGVSTEYIPPRAYTIANITNASPAVMTFASDVPFVSGDRVRVTYQSTGMTQVNRTSPYLTRIDSRTFEMYSNSTRTTPVNSSAYGVYAAGGMAALQPPGRNKGLSGFQEVCGVWLQGSRAVVRDFKATNFFTAATMRGPLTTVVKNITGITLGNPTTITCPGHNLITGMSTLIAGVVGPTAINVNVAVTRIDADTFTAPVDTTSQPAYVSGGTCTNYDNRALASGLEISRIRAVGCDFVVTAGQYENFLIDGVRMEDPTEYTVPPHAIYLQNPSTTGQSYEGFAQRGIIRDVVLKDYPFQRTLRLSNVKDVTMEGIILDGCNGGINLSRCFRAKVVAPNITALQNLSVGIELTDTGEDNQIVGGLISGASGATFTGILASDTNPRTEVLGTTFITDNATWSSSSRRMVMAELQSGIKASDVTVYHQQANTAFAFAATGSTGASIDFTLPKINGGGLIAGSGTAAITGLISTDLLPAGYDLTLSTSVNVGTATLALRKVPDEKTLTTLPIPMLVGSTTPGTNTYGLARGYAKCYRIGQLVFVSGAVQLTALDTDGTMAGNIRITNLPYTVAAGTTGGGTAICQIWHVYPSANFSGLPAANSGVMVRPVEGTTQLEVGYMAPATTGETWTPFTKANLTNTSLIPFQGVYFTTDAL